MECVQLFDHIFRSSASIGDKCELVGRLCDVYVLSPVISTATPRHCCCCFAFHLRNINTAEEILSSPAHEYRAARAPRQAPYKWDEEWWTWMVCAHMAISNTHIGSRYTRRQRYIYVVSRIFPFHLCTETRAVYVHRKIVYVCKTRGHHHIHTHLLHGRGRVQCTYTYFAYINSNISRVHVNAFRQIRGFHF